MAIMERGNTQQARGQPRDDPDQRDEAQEQPPMQEPEQQPDERPPADRTLTATLTGPRVRVWAWRIGVALVVLVVATAMFGGRIGITAAVLAVVVDVVRRSRRDSSIPTWQKSSAAERRTEKQLRSLQRNGYLVLHARAVPRDDEGVSDGQIDHLVIGPSGVYAIDSEKWDKRLPVRTLSHRKLFHGPFNKKERLDEARWEADQASRIIGGQVGFEVPVQPSVAIYGPSIPWKVMRVRDVDVYAGNRARSYLRRRPKILTDTDVQRIFQAAEKALPPKYG
jgi:hypothetical protein